MAQFLTTKGAAFYIEEVISNAQSKLFLLSPFLQLSTIFFERLKDADYRKVHITIVYGKSELKRDEKERLAALRNVTLYFCENLHAKCYYNETHMVLTSMNMYEYSETKNREMGILITKNDDEELFNKAVAEAMSIVRSSKKDEKRAQPRAKKQPQKDRESNYTKKNQGLCIRCHRQIPFAPNKPYCKDCYDSWNVYGNPLYEEKYCHKCGKRETTCMDKPLCYDCYSRLR